MTDENQLIREISSGKESAFRELYDRYASKVYNTAISYVQNDMDAEEVVQDVFHTLYKSASKFKFNSSVSTWIYRITVNKSLDFIRKKNASRRKGVFLSLYKKDSAEIRYDQSDFVHPGVAMENQEDAAFLFAAINELKENQKTAFILTQIEDISQQEAAEIMGITRKAVESLVQRAKANLRKNLENLFPGRGKS